MTIPTLSPLRAEGSTLQFCPGAPPLRPAIEPWMGEFVGSTAHVLALVERYGSPLHVHRIEPFFRNAEELREAARQEGVEMQLFFARKANKILAYVEAARDGGHGVDVASPEELDQTVEAGVPPDRIVLSAAVKTESLLRLAVDSGVTVVLDNAVEIRRLSAVARSSGRTVPVALRLHGFNGHRDGDGSRFGVDVASLDDVFDELLALDATRTLSLRGLHFHIDGYEAYDRIRALDECVAIADRLRWRGCRSLDFIDMGGGFPVTYLEDEAAWGRFLEELDRALLEHRPPVTWRNHGFGRLSHGSRLVGPPQVYPHGQSPTGADWLRDILRSGRKSGSDTSIASALASRGLRLHAEPGRALVHGCGLTLARVEHTKRTRQGLVLVGLAMNGSHCRTRKSELLVDPILVHAGNGDRDPGCLGVLVGSHCTESDAIQSRILRFDRGIDVGDVVVFPNTAGYYMHFVETPSHRFPLPRNVVVDPGGDVRLDALETVRAEARLPG